MQTSDEKLYQFDVQFHKYLRLMFIFRVMTKEQKINFHDNISCLCCCSDFHLKTEEADAITFRF